MMFFFSCDPKINPSPFHPSNFNSITMFLHVGSKNVDFHGHNTSLSVLSKLGLEIKLLTAAQNAMKQTLQMESSALHSFKFEMKAPTFIYFLTRFVHHAQGVNEKSSTLRDYTQYQPYDWYECVKALHALVKEYPNSTLPPIRQIYYSQHKMVPSRLDSKEAYLNSNLNGNGTGSNVCIREILMETETGEKIVVNLDVDSFCAPLSATIDWQIYQNFRATEAKDRPKVDYMEEVQEEIDPEKRARLVNFLVGVSDNLELLPHTLYLTINYVDRYLSAVSIDTQSFQLLGVACLMIASKYEEIYPSEMDVFLLMCPDDYKAEDIEKMQYLVLDTLDFDLYVVTVEPFLRRFVLAVAQGVNEEEKAPLKCLAYYISEFSLLEYDMLCYPPSLVAASAIFLARYVLFPSHKPWNSTLRDYTQYQPSDLYECVKALHALVTECPNPKLPEIRENYSKDEYKCVADKYSCPPTTPLEHFHNISTPQLSY
ncbi:cyclin-A1-4-like [Rutidosis leptorrhynchoides]|uniref:cyclin-A1-4-like n=1 Tax=Rutidosis leptorrhynchoides TaxID=125765 RepID=UPI003A9A0D7B